LSNNNDSAAALAFNAVSSTFPKLKSLFMSGAEVLPLIEGGKGLSISTGQSAGAWAACGGIGTFSGANADAYDENGNLIKMIYKGTTRRERHEELINYAIQGGISQAKIAHDVSGGKGRIHMNVLWEMGGVKRVLEGVLEGAKGLIHGVTCGAGMPYDLAKITAKFDVFYYPIVSSARAFNILWKKAYKDFAELLGGVVYEDPWLAGGHNGISRKENPEIPEAPYSRVAELRKAMSDVGLKLTPIIMAGGVWCLKEWQNWLNNEEIGEIAFQFGTRPLLTQESPIPDLWKKRLLELKEGDVFLNRFSPTGFYSSAVRNDFLENLISRSSRQVGYVNEYSNEYPNEISLGVTKVYVAASEFARVEKWIEENYTKPMKTPDNTVIFVTQDEFRSIRKDQIDCMGCLSQCKFSNWSQTEPWTTGALADPRSFCIQKTLQDIAHAHDKPKSALDNNLMFAGHAAYRFAQDPLYTRNEQLYIPTVQELIDTICLGE
jgi:nitronate monooxygenase